MDSGTHDNTSTALAPADACRRSLCGVVGVQSVGGGALAGVLPGLGSCMIRGPYAFRLLGQVCPLPAMCPSGPLVLLDAGPGSGSVGKAVEPSVPTPGLVFRPFVGAGGRRRAAPVA